MHFHSNARLPNSIDNSGKDAEHGTPLPQWFWKFVGMTLPA
ncbi:MAG TPA: hypothetical protein VEK76_01425 [Candidatus Binatia bacterium]|nr:hypothetical protein [Candidatus Binatia bacterium]